MKIVLVAFLLIASPSIFAGQIELMKGNYGLDRLDCGVKVLKTAQGNMLLKVINNPLNGVFCDKKDLGSLLDLAAYGDKEIACNNEECLSEAFKYTYYIGSYPMTYVLRYRVKATSVTEFILDLEEKECHKESCEFKSVYKLFFSFANNVEDVPAYKFAYWSRVKDPELALESAYAKAMRACFQYGHSRCLEERTALIDVGWESPIASSIVNGDLR